MIVDGKVRKEKFSEKVRENFQKFKEVVERKGKDVLVAGIIGTGVLFGSAKAQSTDSLVIDTSSIRIDSTYIDWSKPRFMGLTYGYYYKPEAVAHHLDTLTIFKIAQDCGSSYDEIAEAKYYWYNRITQRFPYAIPVTLNDTIEAIKDYFLYKYGIKIQKSGSFSDSVIADYIRKYPNRAAALLYDIEIIKGDKYWKYWAIIINSE